MTVTWEENPNFKPRVNAAAAAGLTAAADVVRAYMQASVSIRGYGVPSPIGAPPHYQLGNLHNNIATEPAHTSKLAAAAGVLENPTNIVGNITEMPDVYALHLEFGTHRAAARPFIVASLYDTVPLWTEAFNRVFSEQMAGGVA